MITRGKQYFLVLACSLALCFSWKEANGQVREQLRDLSIEDLMDTYVISSTQHFVRFEEAPSSIFVVNGDQIRRWGIRRLSELIERLVPGATTAEDVDDLILSFRGITADSNYKVVLLLNGHEYNTFWNNGPSSEAELGLMDDIKRVEVLIGPHSALYGSGALLGVINIITRSGRDFSGIRATANYGSGDYRRVDLIAGNEISPQLDFFFSMGGLTSDGYDNNDNFPLNISRFPPSGRLFANVHFKEFQFMSRFSRSSRDLYILPASSVYPNLWTNYDTFFLDAQRKFQWQKNLQLDLNLTYDAVQTQRHDRTLGTKLRAVGEKRYGVKLTSFYSGWKNHTLVLGAQYRRDQFGEDWAGHNFNFSTVIKNGLVTGIPADPFQKRVLTPYGRNMYALYGQDSFNLTDKISLLLGFRFDRIEEFRVQDRNRFSPRAALVIKPAEKTILKAIVTTGVSRPLNAATTSPDEIGFGNPTVLDIDDPEKMHALEFSASHKISPSLEASLNVFYNSFQDIYGVDPTRIAPPFVLISAGRIDYAGFEAVVSSNPTPRTFLRIIHQYVRPASIDDPYASLLTDPYLALTTPDGNHLHNYPEDITKLLVDVRLNKYLSVNANTNFVWNNYGVLRGQTRNSGFYALLNVNAVWTIKPKTELIFSGYNLFNQQKQVPPLFFKAELAKRNFNVNASFQF